MNDRGRSGSLNRGDKGLYKWGDKKGLGYFCRLEEGEIAIGGEEQRVLRRPKQSPQL